MTGTCAACSRPTPAAELTPHEALERVRSGRDGAVRAPEPPFTQSHLLERSPRYASYLVTRPLCPACLAAARASDEDERAGLRRMTAYAALAAVAVFVAALAFPRMWPQAAAWLSLRRTAPPPAPASAPYKPPFPAAMPTAS